MKFSRHFSVLLNLFQNSSKSSTIYPQIESHFITLVRKKYQPHIIALRLRAIHFKSPLWYVQAIFARLQFHPMLTVPTKQILALLWLISKSSLCILHKVAIKQMKNINILKFLFLSQSRILFKTFIFLICFHPQCKCRFSICDFFIGVVQFYAFLVRTRPYGYHNQTFSIVSLKRCPLISWVQSVSRSPFLNLHQGQILNLVVFKVIFSNHTASVSRSEPVH